VPADGSMSRLGALEERDFRLLFAARTVSQLGSALAPVALAFAILDDLDGSATELGLVLAAAWTPSVVFMLVGGVWADRLPRNRVMVVTDLVLFAAQGATAALLLADRAELWHLVGLQALRGLGEAFFFPAIVGVVPQVVSPERLQQANALLRLSHSSMTIIGAATAGVLTATVGPGWALAFDALTFLASAGFLVRIRIPPLAREAGGAFMRELREGWSEFWSRTWLWTFVLAATIVNLALVAGSNVLGPVVAKESLGGAAAWGAIVAAEGAGLVVGGLTALRFRPERPLLVSWVALISVAPLLALLATTAPLLAIMAAAAISGFGLELANVLWVTVMQQQIPEDRLSRVSAYDLLGSYIAIPIGLIAAGPVADLIGVSETIWLATAVLLAGVLPLIAVPDVRRRGVGSAPSPS
jgi:predicted MFS family arabinose efflux permease